MEKLSSTYCDICRGKGKHAKVRTICKECREFYCKDCSDSHSILKVSKDHTLVDLSSTYCDICDEKKIKAKVRTICKECREFYCKDCSDSHSIMKMSKNHTQIDLDPPDENDPSASTQGDETELSSDFLEQLTVRENTVLYRAQVAVDDSACARKAESDISRTEISCDPMTWKADKCGEFSVKRPDDIYIAGVLVISDKVVICDLDNRQLHLFDQSGSSLSVVESKHGAWGITHVIANRFATCGYDESTVRLWSVQEDKIVNENITYDVGHASHGIHYNGRNFSVLHVHANAITLLDTQGRRVRKIVVKEAFGKKMQLSYGIHMDSETHNIYVSCRRSVLCVSVEGDPVWFSPFSHPFGITEINGVLCVADNCDRCIYLMTKTGKYKKQLLDKDVLINKPSYMSFDKSKETLYLTFFEKNFVRMFHVST